MVSSVISSVLGFREGLIAFFPVHQDTQQSMTPLGEVEKAFPPRRSLCMNRLTRRAKFICSRCSLEKTSKLVAYAKDKGDEPLCNGCYGNILSTSEKQGEAQ